MGEARRLLRDAQLRRLPRRLRAPVRQAAAVGLALGDTLLLERGRDLVGFAICHTPGVSEAPSGALYVKFLAIDPAQRKPEHLEQFVTMVEAFGQELGVQRVILPVYSRYWTAYNLLVQCGYQIDFTMIRMQRNSTSQNMSRSAR